MGCIQIDCPDSVLLSLKESPDAFARDLRLTAAMKFYELGRLSSGRAAELAGISRVSFLRELGHFGVSDIERGREDLGEDARNA